VAESRAAFVVYLMAGDPDLRMTESLATACEAGGADLLELGIPFSDPIADGPEIQEAGQRALRAGTRPRDVIGLAARIRQETEIPLVLMTYMNPVLAMGLPTFAERAASAGVDGVVVPDLSLEASPEIREPLDAHGVDMIQLVAPSTPPTRAAAIADASRGFLYVVARYGTTGARSSLPEDLRGRIAAPHREGGTKLGEGLRSNDWCSCPSGCGRWCGRGRRREFDCTSCGRAPRSGGSPKIRRRTRYGTCRRADDLLHFFEQTIGEFDPFGGRRTRPSARSCW